MPILYDLTSEPLAKTSIRNAGMLTTMRVSAGTAFGPGSMAGPAFLANAAFNGNVIGTVVACAGENVDPVGDARASGALSGVSV